MGSSIKLTTLIFLIVLAITVFVWLLRGFGVLTVIPGSVLWGLIFFCIVTAVFSTLR
ncbi:hypothetical protein H6F43_05505 [Leptolyngbya sp. FACHB-36]|uniref:hypothetical protein n=1 Tax=Leptolyngbya sp. FACHB-36 TaxID=2692808 RepID=UPI001681A271|nr:hypothetical protein [Leptolyngbya sp. FACHB-36]MBD2019642.1 hypothetical protein [Leptolyngbya sp. FACHB-36]